MKFLFILLSVLFFSACGGSSSSSYSSTEVEYRDISLDFFKSFPVGQYEVSDEKSLRAIWDIGIFYLYPIGIVVQPQSIPVINFEKYEIHAKVWPDNYWCYRPVVNKVILINQVLEIHFSNTISSTLACLRIGPAQVFLEMGKTDAQSTVWVQDE